MCHQCGVLDHFLSHCPSLDPRLHAHLAAGPTTEQGWRIRAGLQIHSLDRSSSPNSLNHSISRSSLLCVCVSFLSVFFFPPRRAPSLVFTLPLVLLILLWLSHKKTQGSEGSSGLKMGYGVAAAVRPPGVGNALPSAKQVKLDKESELRIEVAENSPLRLRLVTGSAEIFGTEIPPEIWLTVPSRVKFAVFTWYGATIEMDGATETDYTADETPMISYVNVHAILEARRNRAKASSSSNPDSSQGPRVIVVGPTDSGKSTVSRMLLSWAAKQGWKPTFVDLDIGQGSITIPGCIAATPIEMPIDPVEGISLDMPLVYYYGHTTPSVNVELYKVLVKELSQMLERQFVGNAESRAAGMVINTMGWIEGTGYELLLHAIDAFNADVILVLGQEKLWSMLKEVLKRKPTVDVVKLQRSGGIVSRNAKYRQKSRSYRIREYFYGLANDLSPHSNVANFSDLAVYRIGGGPQAPRSALPIGAEPAADPTRVVPVNISQDMLHLVLAVSFAKEPDQIISSNVAGFIYITDVDVQRRKITYLAPSAGELPNRILIIGSLAWLET